MRARALTLSLALSLAALVTPATAQETESSDYVHVVDHAKRGEIVFLLGPVHLPAGATHEGGHHRGDLPLQVVEFPRAGWIHGFVTDMVDASGAPLRESYLHHVNVIDPSNRELFSPISRRIMAAGPETGKKELPESMGLPVAAGQRLLVKAVFHNPGAEERHGLYLRIRFSFTPSQAGEGRAGIYPVYLDVRPPVGRKSFDLPPGPSSQSWEGSPAVSGRLLLAAGHMHDYATGLRLEDVTEGKVLWEVSPVVDSAGRIQSIPVGSFWKDGGVPLRSDHVYRLTVTYDNPTGTVLRGGGMGTLGGVFIPEPGEAWPAVDPQHPDYVADLRYTRGLGLEDAASGAAGGPAGDVTAHHPSGPEAAAAPRPDHAGDDDADQAAGRSAPGAHRSHSAGRSP